MAAYPGERSLHDPALGQNDEASNIAAFDDVERPVAGAGDERSHLGSSITAIGNDALDERETSPRLTQQPLRTVAVLDIGGMDIDVQQQALRIDEDVALAAEDLLPGIEPGPVERTPPFSAPLALCASRIAMVGLASRPARSRLAT